MVGCLLLLCVLDSENMCPGGGPEAAARAMSCDRGHISAESALTAHFPSVFVSGLPHYGRLVNYASVPASSSVPSFQPPLISLLVLFFFFPLCSFILPLQVLLLLTHSFLYLFFFVVVYFYFYYYQPSLHNVKNSQYPHQNFF